MIVVGLDPCAPERRGPRSRKQTPLKVPVWAKRGPADCGYLFCDDGDPNGRIDLLVCERPHPKGPAGKVALVTMGVWAGFLLAQTPQAARSIAIPATHTAAWPGWKEILIPGFGNAPKAVFCANVKQRFSLPQEWDPKCDTDQDKIDAIGLCEAGHLLDEKTIRKWEIKL